MADAIYICILRFWKSDNWYLPETWQVICQNTRQEQVRSDVGLLSLNKIPSKSVKNEQKALANPANRIN